MTVSKQYTKMIQAYTAGQDETALELARSLINQKLPKAKMKDVEHVIAMLKAARPPISNLSKPKGIKNDSKS